MKISQLIKLYFTLTAFLLASMPMLLAKPVSVKLACEVGFQYVNANARTPLRDVGELTLVTTYRTAEDKAAFYVFNTNKGFVIVAADDCATPILGFSDEGQFGMDELPIQLKEYLQHFLEQIQYGIENHLEADEATARQWDLVKTTGRINDKGDKSIVLPMVNSNWGQSCYYNSLCPEDNTISSNCGHVLVGCVAVAMAQIMHYWGYPATGSGSHSYDHPQYGNQFADFGAATYQWNDMPNALSNTSSPAQIDAVATLLYHCGVSVEMDYGSTSSSAYSPAVADALKDYFGYADDCLVVAQDDYDDWLDLIKTCLDQRMPVYYYAIGRHAFVCDGYDNNDHLHFNWGWEGSYNAFYALDALKPGNHNYNGDHAAIINIHPQIVSSDAYQVTATVSPMVGGVVTGEGSYQAYQSCTLTATSNVGFSFLGWREDGFIVSTEAEYSFFVNQNRHLEAVFGLPPISSVSIGYHPDSNDPNSSSAQVSWEIDPSFGITGAYPPQTALSEGFEFGIPDDWTMIDADGDGCQWQILTFKGHSGKWCISSANYIPNVSNLNPDNYLVSPKVVLGGTFSFWASARNAFYFSEHIGVAVSTASNVDTLSFTTIQQWTLSAKEETPDGLREITWWQFTVDLSDYAGQTGYIAIRHFNSVGMTYLNIDDVFYGFGRETPQIQYYRVFRTSCDSNPPNTQMVADQQIGTSYIDTEWGNLPFGSYKYGVCSVGAFGSTSDTIWSNCLCNGIGHAITAIANPAEGGAIDGAGMYGEGRTCTLTATANTGYTFTNWTKNGTVVSTNATYSFTVTDDESYVANFSLNSYDITATANPAEGGEVVGANTYHHGETATLTATANVGYHFINWMRNGSVVSTNPTYSFTVTGTGDYVATFGLNSYAITATANTSAGGSVTGAGNYNHGATATLTATTNTGYTFLNWTKGGIEVATTPTYSFIVTEAGSYVANFSLNNYEISAIVNPNDGGMVDGIGTYNHGFTATLTAIPNIGYGFVNWTEDGMVVSTNDSYSFTVTGARTLVANFELMTYAVTVAADPPIGGMVTGAGSYLYGSMATVEVTPNLHCQFDHWTLNGTVVSEELAYTFEVTEDSHLVAHLHFYDAVDENNASMLSVYPNPAKDKLNVCGVAMQTVKVFNAIGQVIIVKECDNVENEEIDLGTFASGLYMLSVRTVSGTLVNKIFVKE